MIDIEQAKLDPTSVFKEPSELFNSNEINKNDKLLILKQWEYDCKELLTATDENMGDENEDTAEILSKVQELISMLDD